jgi:hypothetical protein
MPKLVETRSLFMYAMKTKRETRISNVIVTFLLQT